MEDHGSELTGRFLGAAIEVHRHLGAGFLEQTYEKALAIELRLRGIAFEKQKEIHLHYKGEDIGEGRIDLLIEGTLVVELKAIEKLTEAHKTQVYVYLQAIKQPLGLLVNFHAPRLMDGVARVAA